NAARASPHPGDLAIGPDVDSAVSRDALDGRLRRSDVSERSGPVESLPHRSLSPRKTFFEKDRIEDGQAGVLFRDERLAGEAGERGVVLVNALHRDPLRRGPGRFGKGAPP